MVSSWFQPKSFLHLQSISLSGLKKSPFRQADKRIALILTLKVPGKRSPRFHENGRDYSTRARARFSWYPKSEQAAKTRSVPRIKWGVRGSPRIHHPKQAARTGTDWDKSLPMARLAYPGPG
jgi:hypothetical protein